jgi:hypothetical protein
MMPARTTRTVRVILLGVLAFSCVGCDVVPFAMLVGLGAVVWLFCGIVVSPNIALALWLDSRRNHWIPVFLVIIPSTHLGALLGATALGFFMGRIDPHATIIASAVGLVLGAIPGMFTGALIVSWRFTTIRANLQRITSARPD